MAMKKSPAEIVLTVDKKLAVLWKRALARLKKATREGAQDWDERYEAIATILEHVPPLYLAGGYATDKAFIAEVVREDRSAVYRNVRVAKYASAEDIERYGTSKLDLVAALFDLLNGGQPKSRTPVAFDKLRCTFQEEGRTVTRPFPDCSAKQLRLAIAHARGWDAPSKRGSPAARAVAASIKASGVKGVTFSVSTKTLSLRVPLNDVAKVARALVGFVPPEQ